MSKYGKKVNRCLMRIKQGDKSRYRELFDLTFNHLSVIARMYLRNKSYCDDVVMETFERVMKYINTFNETQDGYNWLCKITEMVAYAYNKNESNNSKTPERDDISDDFTKLVELKTDLDSIINRLDLDSRTIIISYFYLDMTYEEIGKKVGKTKSAICKRIKNIIKELKNYL